MISPEERAESLWRRRTRLPDVVIRDAGTIKEIADIAAAIREAVVEAIAERGPSYETLENRVTETEESMRHCTTRPGRLTVLHESIAEAVAEAVAEEREACALIADNGPEWATPMEVGNAIRHADRSKMPSVSSQRALTKPNPPKP